MQNFTVWGRMVALLSVLLLGACSDGTSGPAAPASSTLSGTAAVGAPIVGAAITLNCAAGNTLTAMTNTAGGWSVTPSGQTLPCAIQATGGTINSVANSTPYHSIAISLGVVNITPLTDMLVANMSRATPTNWFTALSSNPAGVSAFTQVQVDASLCQSASNTFHPSASNSFHFLRLLRAIFALLKAVGIVTRFQNIAMMGNTVK